MGKRLKINVCVHCKSLRVHRTIKPYFLAPGPGGELLEELRERPQAVSVRLLDSSTAAVSWAASSENHNGSLVSVVSTTCLKPSLSQRMENTYCSEVTWTRLDLIFTGFDLSFKLLINKHDEFQRSRLVHLTL